jgi:hypothetical protein
MPARLGTTETASGESKAPERRGARRVSMALGLGALLVLLALGTIGLREGSAGTASPGAGLDLLAPLDADARLAGHHRLDAVRAHLWEMAGERARAIHHYRAAAERTASLPERDYLITKAARLARSSGADLDNVAREAGRAASEGA